MRDLAWFSRTSETRVSCARKRCSPYSILGGGGYCGLVPRKVALWGFCLSRAFAGELTWPGVNSMLSCFCERSLAVSLSTWFWGQWPEPCFLAVRVWDLGPLQGHSSEGHGSLSEGRGSRDGPSPLSSNPSPRSSTLCPPNPPLLPGHSLCKSGIFCWANGTSSLPFTHLATMGSCYGLEERGTDTCCLQVGPEHPAELAPEDPLKATGVAFTFESLAIWHSAQYRLNGPKLSRMKALLPPQPCYESSPWRELIDKRHWRERVSPPPPGPQ